MHYYITNVTAKHRLLAEDSSHGQTDVILKNWPQCTEHLYN